MAASYRVAVAVPGESKPSHAFLLCGGKDGREALPESKINI